MPSFPVSPIFLLLLIVIFSTFQVPLAIFYSLLLNSLCFSLCSMFLGILKHPITSVIIYIWIFFFFLTSTNIYVTFIQNAFGNLKPNILEPNTYFPFLKLLFSILHFDD